MQNYEATALCAMLSVAYPERFKLTTDGARLWERMLADLDFSAAEAVVLGWIAAERWPPSIADIRGGVIDAQLALPSVDEAWGQIVACLRSADGRFVGHPLVREVLQQLGGMYNLRQSENAVSDRAHFFKLYAARHERERRAALGVEPLAMGQRPLALVDREDR